MSKHLFPRTTSHPAPHMQAIPAKLGMQGVAVGSSSDGPRSSLQVSPQNRQLPFPPLSLVGQRGVSRHDGRTDRATYRSGGITSPHFVRARGVRDTGPTHGVHGGWDHGKERE